MLEVLRKLLEKKAGCDPRTWRILTNCNLPLPLLMKALNRSIIPKDFAKKYFSSIKEQEKKLKEKSLEPLYYIVVGAVGNYKTLMLTRLFAIKTIELKSPVLFLTSDELQGLYAKELELHTSIDDITYALEVEIKVRGIRTDYTQIVPFTSIPKTFSLVFIDDVEENAIPALAKIDHYAYENETKIFITSNIPLSELLSTLPKKVISRVTERGVFVEVSGKDRRKNEDLVLYSN